METIADHNVAYKAFACRLIVRLDMIFFQPFMFGTALAEQMAAAAEGQLRQWAAERGLFLPGRVAPGYGDWPISLQPLLAETLDTARQIGLYVTDTYLMTPRKSVTALLGVSDHPVGGQLAGCGHCVLRARCNYRKRGITCAEQ